jgi:glycosyltransferase involved in cell wall biosynthesis
MAKTSAILISMIFHSEIGVIVIGRNEGERLKNCLRSLVGKTALIVYVDSGSTDGSVEFSRSLGVDVVELDLTKPFSMARARNTGAQRVRELRPDLPYLHFVDGDCEVQETWFEKALTTLRQQPDVTVVCGRRRERFPQNSVYNRLCDIEWNTPVGPAKACGGDALFRAEAFFAVKGFNESLIAGEEPELCMRLRQAGGSILRIDAEMTLHDANILTFRAWWKRNLRGGYGAADVVHRLRSTTAIADIPFWNLHRSAPVWSLGWLGVTLLLTGIHPLGLLAGLALWMLQSLRIARSVRSRAANWTDALTYGAFTLLGKWPQLLGRLRYQRDLRRGNVIHIIEYK